MDAGDLFSSWVERAVGVGADADADADADVRRPSRRWRRVVARDMRMSYFLFSLGYVVGRAAIEWWFRSGCGGG